MKPFVAKKQFGERGYTREQIRAVIDEVMYELMRLSGQEYVDLYEEAAAISRSSASSWGTFFSTHSLPT